MMQRYDYKCYLLEEGNLGIELQDFPYDITQKDIVSVVFK